ncbi:glycosyltransferase [Candidatus Neomarinimicrobiota bacterium]
MKVLYISPENTVGTLSLWKKAHEKVGNQCDFITLYPTRHDYDPGYCLNLPLVSSNSLYIKFRHKYYKYHKGSEGSYKEKEGFPPVWKPNSYLEKKYFRFRDWLWHFKIEKVINELDLLKYDLYHIEWGLEFYRDGRFVTKLAEMGKHIVCSYHGQDLRNRGVIERVDRLSNLNVTSELDLLEKHPNIKYLFLPFDTSLYEPREELNDKIKICHSPTNRHFKGSDTIIPVCEKIAEEENVEFKLIENKSITEAMKIKQSCDILIDQVHNRGGWGYGMNSVEAMSMGLVCVTELIPKYEEFISDHPFVNVTGDTLYITLKKLVRDRDRIPELKRKSREWVVKYHDLHNTAKILYRYYEELKWI